MFSTKLMRFYLFPKELKIGYTRRLLVIFVQLYSRYDID